MIQNQLRGLSGMVEGRVAVGENGTSWKYCVVKQKEYSFVIHEKNIAAIS